MIHIRVNHGSLFSCVPNDPPAHTTAGPTLLPGHTVSSTFGGDLWYMYSSTLCSIVYVDCASSEWEDKIANRKRWMFHDSVWRNHMPQIRLESDVPKRAHETPLVGRIELVTSHWIGSSRMTSDLLDGGGGHQRAPPPALWCSSWNPRLAFTQ